MVGILAYLLTCKAECRIDGWMDTDCLLVSLKQSDDITGAKIVNRTGRQADKVFYRGYLLNGNNVQSQYWKRIIHIEYL